MRDFAFPKGIVIRDTAEDPEEEMDEGCKEELNFTGEENPAAVQALVFIVVVGCDLLSLTVNQVSLVHHGLCGYLSKVTSFVLVCKRIFQAASPYISEHVLWRYAKRKIKNTT